MNVYERYLKRERNFTEDEWFQIVKKYPFVIHDIKNPSERLQLEAVKQNKFTISCIVNPTKNVQLCFVDFIISTCSKSKFYTFDINNVIHTYNITDPIAIKKMEYFIYMRKACT